MPQINLHYSTNAFLRFRKFSFENLLPISRNFWAFCGEKFAILTRFLVKDSAEASAEASVEVAEASVSAESHFRPIRSFTSTLEGNKKR